MDAKSRVGLQRILLLTFAAWLLSAAACTDATAPTPVASREIGAPQGTLAIPSTTAQVSTGHIQTCGLRSDGTVLCWVGNPAYAAAAVVPPGLASVVQISAGGFHACALKTDGTVVCWDDEREEDDHGQSTVPPALGPVAQVSSGAWHTCALIAADQSVVCWGGDDDSIIDHDQSIVPPDLGPVTQVSAGGFHTCALKVDQTVKCWGWNEFDQTILPPGLTTVVEVSAGYFHSCARKANTTVVCWGSNHAGNAERTYIGQATVPGGLTDISQVSAGSVGSCVRKMDSTVLCWGDASNEYGLKTIPADLGPVAQVSIKYLHVCALKTDGTVICWGDNGDGRLAVPAGLNLIVPFAQSIVVTSRPPSHGLPGGTYTVSATGGDSGNPVTFSSLTPLICTVSGSLVSLTNTGSCVVAADQAGGTGYLAAPQVTQTFTVYATQTISFTSTPPSPALTGGAYTVAATGGASGNTIVFTSNTPAVCTIAGDVASLVGAGSCTIAANQAAGGNYLAAAEQTQAFTVVTPAQATLDLITTITSMGLADGVANSLSAPLNNFDTNNVVAACGKLDAFINQVDSKLRNGQLTTSAAGQLLQTANAIRANLGCA